MLETDRKQLQEPPLFSKALQLGLAFVASLLLVATTALLMETPHSPPYAQVFASRSSADVTLFSGSNESAHSFELHFHGEVGNPRHCEADNGELCLEWSDSGSLTVRKIPRMVGGVEDRRTVTAAANVPLSVCFDLNHDHLYKGLVRYPLHVPKQPYLSWLYQPMGINLFEGQRQWFSSAGLNINVHPNVPLFVTQSEKKLCLTANYTHPYSLDFPIVLSYDTCGHRPDLKAAVKCFNKLYKKPVPPDDIISQPIWSIWMELRGNVTAEKIKQFANNIRDNKFGISIIEIDGEWESCYGSLKFSKDKFPDPKGMVDTLHSHGIYVSLQIHPFVDPGCNNTPNIEHYAPFMQSWPNASFHESYWETITIQGTNSSGPRLINFTNPAAADWYISRLENLRKIYGVDTFKFNYGIPLMTGNNRMSKFNLPNQYISNFIKAVDILGTSGMKQDLTLINRIENPNPIWESENWGLKSIIPSILQTVHHGHELLMPGIIRGNTKDGKVSSEFFIRWLQLHAFLPILHFSTLPWTFDNQTVAIIRNYTALHFQYKDRIMSAIKDEENPVINPIWWISPNDTIAQDITTEYLVGTELLVAPVLEEGAVTRDVYLPRGRWRDENYGVVYLGPIHVRNYRAPLSILPFFQRLPS